MLHSFSPFSRELHMFCSSSHNNMTTMNGVYIQFNTNNPISHVANGLAPQHTFTASALRLLVFSRCFVRYQTEFYTFSILNFKHEQNIDQYSD